MISEEDLKTFPWKIVERVVFKKLDLSTLITFRSGARLRATSSSQESWDEFIREATLHLGCEGVDFE